MELKQCFSNMKLLGVFFAVIGAIFNFGSCDTVCDFDRVGPECQFKNIAYGKDSRFDSNTYPPRYSYLANDNNRSSCSYTSDRNIAAPWWNIWLPEYTAFKKLEFVTEESHLSHFPDFEVTVYNTTESNFLRKGPVTGGLICYNHNNSVPQSTKIQVTCNGSPVGNLIRLQLHSKRFQLVLCDLRLYGDCYNGFYGNDCQKCSDNCQSSRHLYCDSKSGHCFQGCKPGWKGDRCETECENDMWGQDCLGKCGKCDNLTCDHITATCPRGCSAGFKPPYCTRECDDGFFGKNCRDRCSSNCLTPRANALCDKMNGTCLNGCKAGYQGSQCSIKCDDGKWGINCTNECGKCLTRPCNHVNGYCQDGCAAGYKKTNDCTAECDDGKWGINCTNDCGKCLSSTCNHENGNCLDGCAAGYKSSPKCITECDDGSFGPRCASFCSQNCAHICDKTTGMCSDCKTGWKGESCNETDEETTQNVSTRDMSEVIMKAAKLIAKALDLYTRAAHESEKALTKVAEELARIVRTVNGLKRIVTQRPNNKN